MSDGHSGDRYVQTTASCSSSDLPWPNQWSFQLIQRIHGCECTQDGQLVALLPWNKFCRTCCQIAQALSSMPQRSSPKIDSRGILWWSIVGIVVVGWPVFSCSAHTSIFGWLLTHHKFFRCIASEQMQVWQPSSRFGYEDQISGIKIITEEPLTRRRWDQWEADRTRAWYRSLVTSHGRARLLVMTYRCCLQWGLEGRP